VIQVRVTSKTTVATLIRDLARAMARVAVILATLFLRSKRVTKMVTMMKSTKMEAIKILTQIAMANFFILQVGHVAAKR
jgi:hypothetical protein